MNAAATTYNKTRNAATAAAFRAGKNDPRVENKNKKKNSSIIRSCFKKNDNNAAADLRIVAPYQGCGGGGGHHDEVIRFASPEDMKESILFRDCESVESGLLDDGVKKNKYNNRLLFDDAADLLEAELDDNDSGGLLFELRYAYLVDMNESILYGDGNIVDDEYVEKNNNLLFDDDDTDDLLLHPEFERRRLLSVVNCCGSQGSSSRRIEIVGLDFEMRRSASTAARRLLSAY